MANHGAHRFHGHLREWFRLLSEMGILTQQEAVDAVDKLPTDDEPARDEGSE